MIVQAEEQLQRWLGDNVPQYAEIINRHELNGLRDLVLREDPSLRFDISRLRLLCIEKAIARCYAANKSTDQSEQLGQTIRRQARAAFEVFMQGRNNVTFFPDALDVLEELRHRFKLVGLTNGNADIQRIGLDQYFEFCMSPVEAQARKPDVAIFAATRARAQCSPTQIIHVGDHPQEDIAGAKASGWHAIWVQHKQPDAIGSTSAHTSADAIINKLAELPAVISRIAQQATD